jgi:hypothetical protein
MSGMNKRVIVFFALVAAASFLTATCSSHIVLGASVNAGNRVPLQQQNFSNYFSGFISKYLSGKVETIKILEKLFAQMEKGIEALMNMMDGIHKTPQLPS